VSKKRLLIHAGVHQTGTALIQKMLSNNGGHLAANGVLYPPFGTTTAVGFVNHQRLAWNIQEKKIEYQALKDWAATLTQAEAGTIVLSAQDFCRLLDLSFLDVFLDLFEVEAVFYVRRQDEWVNSWYNLHIKWPFHAKLCRSDPIEFLEHLDEFHWIRYFDTAERWAARIGRERVRVRVLERGQIEDPVADICELAGMGPKLDSKNDRIALCEEQLNGSLPANQLHMLRRLGTIQYSAAVRAKITNAVRNAGGSANANTNVYRREIRQLIIGHYAPQNEKLAGLYLGRSDGVLFRDNEFPQDPADRNDGMDQRLIYMFIRKIINEFNPGIGDT